MTPNQKMMRDETLATRALLAATFPKAFAGKGEKKIPLKIGIFHDIKQAHPEFRSAALHRALNDYTGGPLYLKAMVAGAARINLEGDAVGFVTEEQAAHAAARLRQINAAKARRVRAAGDATKVRRESERAMEATA